MVETLLWLTLATAALGAVLAAVSLARSSGASRGFARELREEFRLSREEARAAERELREEVAGGLKSANDVLGRTLEGLGKLQHERLESMTKQLKDLAESSQAALERIRKTFDERVKELQANNEKKLDQMRAESAAGLKAADEALSKTLGAMDKSQRERLEALTKQLTELTDSNQASLDRVRKTFDERVKELQASNEKKLDEMRKTVDEKLHDTLEKRLGESFKLVSDRLDTVHKGLGEMQSLAADVGGLKRVLTNVKARGTWAEVQLGAILEQVLTPDQYGKNVAVRPDSAERVEYAVRLPGPRDDPESRVWLAIDSKFPQEDYVRLQEAADRAESEAVQAAAEALARAVRGAAKDIRDKYVHPPYTTDFAVLFLATEGLYAEVLRQPALVEELQNTYRVVPAGPTTLAAILSSLRMGFQTVAIEQRAAEVWRVLAAVKSEFSRFGDVLATVKRQLDTASRTIDKTSVRTRAMERKLREVERLPESEALGVLDLPPAIEAGSDDGRDGSS